jgi:hypothetical protein
VTKSLGVYRWDGSVSRLIHGQGNNVITPPDPGGGGGGSSIPWDWSDSNVPYAFTDASEMYARLPAGLSVADLNTSSSDFYTNLANTVGAAPGRVVVRLPARRHVLHSFRLIGSSGDPKYAFGFWFPKLAGFICEAGPLNCSIEMAANSYTDAQLQAIAAMTSASNAPLQAGLCRIDSSESTPLFLAGVTFRADDQQMLTSVPSDVPAATPQPAPHQGVVLYPASVGAGVITHCRFQGAGRAMTSSPPFEMANMTSQFGKFQVFKTEFDGRLSEVFNTARPRRCGPLMLNNEETSLLQDSWLHHSNVSRYAANDDNRVTTGAYSLTRVKAEQITNTKNDGLGGYTNATPLGWESVGGTITLTDCIVSQDNPYTDKQIAQHLQLTTVARNPAGGRLRVNGGVFRNPGFPVLDGWLCFRITASHWQSDGYDTTLAVYRSDGYKKAPYVYTGAWPPTAAALAAARVAPDTHYLVRQS